MNSKIKLPFVIGDLFEIPLSNSRYSYGQYAYFDDRPDGLGTLVRIFNFFSSEPVSFEKLRMKIDPNNLMFPPVFVGLLPAIRSGRWRIIGNLTVESFRFPKFRITFGTSPGIYHDWKIWNGIETINVGDLPAEYRKLEIQLVWGAEGLEDRIMSGSYWGGQLL